MANPQSKITAKGQISVPAEVREKLGARPGSTLEWVEKDGEIVVRRVGKYTSEDIHKALFPQGAPKPRTLAELKEGMRRQILKEYARS